MKYVFHACAAPSVALLALFLDHHTEARRARIHVTCDPQDGDSAVDATLRRDGLVHTAQGLLVIPDAGRPFLADACRVLDGQDGVDD